MDIPRIMINTPDSGFLIAGSSTSYTPMTAALLLKLDSTGNFQWAKTVEDTSGQFHLRIDQGIALSTGNYLFSGTSYNPAGIRPWLLITDINGNILFQREYYFSAGLWQNIFGLTELQNGTIVVCGNNDYGPSPIYPEKKLLLLHLDSDLSSLWSKEYHYHFTEKFTSVITSHDHQILLQAHSIDSMPPGREDVLLIKTDTSGTILWAKQCGDTLPSWNTNPANIPNDISVLPDGSIINLITTNWFNMQSFQYTAIQVLDSIGYQLFAKHYYYTSGGRWQLITAPPNNFYMSNGLHLIKADYPMDVIWQKQIAPAFLQSGNGTANIIKSELGGFSFLSGHYSGGLTNQIYFSFIDSTGNIGCTPQVNNPPIVQIIDLSTIDITPLIIHNAITISDSSTSYLSQTVQYSDTVWCSTATGSDQEPKSPTMVYYPNPVRDYLNIKTEPEINGLDAEIYDALGKYIATITIRDQMLSVASLKRGIYQVCIHTNQSHFNFKIIKN